VSGSRYVAILRAITYVPMKPFRRALEELGFTDVESHATSGNLLFNAPPHVGRLPGARSVAAPSRQFSLRARLDQRQVFPHHRDERRHSLA
jgi:uncharacterized protein (DUF1697 family)